MESPEVIPLLIGISLWIVGILLLRLPTPCGHRCPTCEEAQELKEKFISENKAKREEAEHLWLHRFVIGDAPCPKCKKEK